MKIIPIGPNQTKVETEKGEILISYKTPVALCSMYGKLLVTEGKHSKTTFRHINKWLNGRKVITKPQSFFDNLI